MQVTVTATDASGDAAAATASAGVGPADPWATPFLARSSSGPISLTGQSDVTISGKRFQGIGNDQSCIRLTGCHRVLITECDFADIAQCITVQDCTDVEISWCRYRNITGPHQRNGSNRANFTQWVDSWGGSIHDNKGVGGDTEDIISIYGSGGHAALDPLLIERNHFEGTTWTSTSGSGLMLGDNGGSHIVARDNVLLNPGQVGIGIPGGVNIRLENNVLYGERRKGSNIAIYIWNQSPSTCSGHAVVGNRAWWRNATGAQNHYWDAGNCGPVTASGNVWNAALDPSALRVTL
jgi:hypothetical protein